MKDKNLLHLDGPCTIHVTITGVFEGITWSLKLCEMDSSPPEIKVEEVTPRTGAYKRRKANERAKTSSPPSSPVSQARHFSPKQQSVSSPPITIEEAECSLSELIDDFERGKLQAFGTCQISRWSLELFQLNVQAVPWSWSACRKSEKCKKISRADTLSLTETASTEKSEWWWSQ